MDGTATTTRPVRRIDNTPDFSAVRQAQGLLYFGFIALPIIAGLDKFFNVLARWDVYLSPMISQSISPNTFMSFVGVVEILAGIIVAIRPKIGGYIVAFWLWGIVLNLLSIPGFFDIALRDFGLSLGALALAKLSE